MISVQHLSNDLKIYISSFLKKKCSYCFKYRFEFDLKNIVYNSSCFFIEHNQDFYIYKCIKC